MSDGTPTDEELLQRYQAGDEDSFVLLFRRHWQRVVAECRRRTNNQAEAEDLASDIFLKLFLQANTIHALSVRGWFFRVVHNDSINWASRNRKLSPMPDDDHFSVRPSDDFTSDDLLVAITQLSPEQQICLKLFLEGRSYKEIAAVSHFSEKAVKSHIQNGRERLKRILSPHE